jgi:hypothetical protein
VIEEPAVTFWGRHDRARAVGGGLDRDRGGGTGDTVWVPESSVKEPSTRLDRGVPDEVAR